MAVTQVKLAQEPGDANFADSDDAAVDYFVYCDDPQDGPYTVRAIFGNPMPGPDEIPTRGTQYAWGNDVGNSTVDKHTVKRERTKETPGTPANVTIVFRVTCHYIRESDEPDQPSPDGSKASSPDAVQPSVVPGYRTIARPVSSAKFKGFFDQDGNLITPAPDHNAGAPPVGTNLTARIDEMMPIQNSCLEPILPVPEIETGVPVVFASAYYRPWNNAWDGIISKTNDASYQILYTDGSGTNVYDRTFPQNTLLLYNIDPQLAQFGNELWYWARMEFWINADGWHDDFFDRGYRVVETSSVSGYTWQPAKSNRGERQQTPISLDGTGRALESSTATNATEVYLRYELRGQADFTQLSAVYNLPP